MIPRKDRFLLDSQWLGESPFLMDFSNTPHNELFLSQGDHFLTNDHYELPEDSFFQTHRLLGFYFEDLLSQQLDQKNDCAILAQNVQIHQDKQTVGELDFILHKDSEDIHLEAAVKFYLSHENSDEWHTWLGPQSHDRLDLKLNKLIDKQTKLSLHPYAQHELKERQLPIELIPKVFLKGRFYYHYSTEKPISPKFSHSEHLRGLWLHRNQVAELLPQDKLYFLIDKSHSFSTVELCDETSLIDLKTLLRYIEGLENNRPFQIAIMNCENESFTEENRLFIVHDLWPEKE